MLLTKMLLGDSSNASMMCVIAFCSFAPPDLLPPRNVDDVHDIMDDLQEQNEIAEEIQNAISQPIGFGMDLDEVSVWECSPAQDVCCVEGPTYYGYKRITVCVWGGGAFRSASPHSQ